MSAEEETGRNGKRVEEENRGTAKDGRSRRAEAYTANMDQRGGAIWYRDYSRRKQ